MEVLFHFIFELIKISILGCVYATLTLVAFKFIGRNKPDSWFDHVSRKKLRLWFLSGLIISFGLFFFMFTYFGDHGLGDSARVPVGHWTAIHELNGTQTYIQDEDINALGISEFVIVDDYVYGLTSSANENYDGKYFVYNLKINKVKTFIQEKDYVDFLKANSLHTKPDYKNFSYYYSRYWNGWRFWLLA